MKRVCFEPADCENEPQPVPVDQNDRNLSGLIRGEAVTGSFAGMVVKPAQRQKADQLAIARA